MSLLSMFRNFWEPFLNLNVVFNGEQEKESIIHFEDRIENSVPRDHRLSSLGKPRDANR